MESDSPYFNKYDTQHLVWSKQLPHWHQDGKYVFVTFRLADSLPQNKLDEFRVEKSKWLALHPIPWNKDEENEYHRKFSTVIDKWLDNNFGYCILNNEKCRAIVERALHFYDGKHYELIAYVIMPKHVHLAIRMLGQFDLMHTVFSIKNYTAKEINKVLGTRGKVWQNESFDRLIRDKEHLKRVTHYIVRNNPRLAWVK